MFFTFEGGEGAGKSSLIASLQIALVAKGFSVLVTREPGGSSLGQKIRSLLLERQEIKMTKKAELFLFLADRTQHMEELIIPFLKKGGIVLCDRFIDSSFAYQSEAFPIQELISLNEYAINKIYPDRTFYLDLDPMIGMERIQLERKTEFDRIESKGIEFHHQVREEFLKLTQIFKDRIVKIDAAQSKETVYHQVLSMILGIIHEQSSKKYSSKYC